MRAYGAETSSLLVAILVLSLLAFASAAQAQGERGDRQGRGFGEGFGMSGQLMTDRMAKRLDLDDTQRQSVANILEAAQPEIQALREQMHDNRAAQAALDSAAPSYSVDLERVAAENGRLASEATLLFSRVRSEVSAVLTEDQLAKLERGQKRGKQRGRRGGDGRRGQAKADDSDGDS